jgi:hypothetical protein
MKIRPLEAELTRVNKYAIMSKRIIALRNFENRSKMTNHILEILIGKFNSRNFCVKYKIVKSKAISLQAWTGPEGSRRFRLSDFKTIGT